MATPIIGRILPLDFTFAPPAAGSAMFHYVLGSAMRPTIADVQGMSRDFSPAEKKLDAGAEALVVHYVMQGYNHVESYLPFFGLQWRTGGLIGGIGAGQFAAREPYAVRETPTRFGRLNLELEPHGAGWRLKFERSTGPAPSEIPLPTMLGDRARLSGVSGEKFRQEDSLVLVEPSAHSWTSE